MRRGFKAEAERKATAVRKNMGIRLIDPLNPMDLAKQVGAEVRCADTLTSRAKLQALEELQPGAFSACTFSFDGRHVIVYNPLASSGRTQSDIAHEVAHLLLKHKVTEVHQIGGITFFSCDSEEEQEANWLAGCLLLPRPLLLRAGKQGLDAASIAENFGVTESMAAFRLRTTGVLRQLGPGKSSS